MRGRIADQEARKVQGWSVEHVCNGYGREDDIFNCYQFKGSQ
jgi:hypothetical protein